jgi:putative membrane protein
MYIRRTIRFKLIFDDSWRFLLIIGLWSALIVYMHDFMGYGLIAVPMLPLSTIGIAVSLYLGFRSKESYERWWDARKVWGDIINKSRAFSSQVHGLLYDKEGSLVSKEVKKDLIYRHIGWLRSLKYQLHSTSRLHSYRKKRMFNHRIVEKEPSDFLASFLKDDEFKHLKTKSNMATQILVNQGKALQKLAAEGYLDSIRHTEMTQTISK